MRENRDHNMFLPIILLLYLKLIIACNTNKTTYIVDKHLNRIYNFIQQYSDMLFMT